MQHTITRALRTKTWLSGKLSMYRTVCTSSLCHQANLIRNHSRCTRTITRANDTNAKFRIALSWIIYVHKKLWNIYELYFVCELLFSYYKLSVRELRERFEIVNFYGHFSTKNCNCRQYMLLGGGDPRSSHASRVSLNNNAFLKNVF